MLAPDGQITSAMFPCVDRASIESKVRDRIAAYEPEWQQQRLEPWLRDWLAPVLDRVDLACVAWEEVLQNIRRADPAYGNALQEFYKRCLTFNRPPGRQTEVMSDPGAGTGPLGSGTGPLIPSGEYFECL